MNTQQTLADSLTLSAEAIATIMQGLEPLTHYGPAYKRAVATHLGDVRLFLGRGQLAAATHYLRLAEVAAGDLTWEDCQALDPFNAPRV